MAKAGQVDSNAETLWIVPDCNVLIQGKALHSLPWLELGAGPFELLLLPTVVREIDGLKMKSGRIGKIARSISSEIRGLVGAPNMRAELVQRPRVHWRIVRDRVSVVYGQGLDLQHNDDVIINHALCIREGGIRTLFLTGDTIAFVNAQSHNLDAFLLPDDWLRPPETDDQSKALKASQAENARLKSQQPNPELWFADREGAKLERLEITLPIYQSLTPTLIDALMERVENAARPTDIAVTEFDLSPGETDLMKIGDAYKKAIETGGGLLPITQRDVDEYRDSYAAWLIKIRSRFEVLHDEWRDRRDTPYIQLVVVNRGSRPAEGALFELETRGPFRVRRPFGGNAIAKVEAKKSAQTLALALPPRPPRRQTRLEALMSGRPKLPNIPIMSPPLRFPTPPDPDTIYWENERGQPSDRLSLTCSNWRHHRKPDEFGCDLIIDQDNDQRGALVARINANNLADPIEVSLPISITIEQRDTAKIATDLVDDFERQLSKPAKTAKAFPMFIRPPRNSTD